MFACSVSSRRSRYACGVCIVYACGGCIVYALCEPLSDTLSGQVRAQPLLPVRRGGPHSPISTDCLIPRTPIPMSEGEG